MKKHASYQVSLKVFLKDSAGKTLVLKAVNGGSYEGFYDFPGGRIDESEIGRPLLETVKRELREEIGEIDVEISSPRPVATGYHFLPSRSGGEGSHVLYIFFEATLKSGEILISDEHLDFEWVSLEGVELEKYFISGCLEGARMYLGK